MNARELKYDVVTMIRSLRTQLANEFDVSPTGDYSYYAGLCDEISRRFVDQFNEKYHKIDNNIVAKIAHGEIKHSPAIAWSDNWSWEHTWVEISFGKYTVYVDGSCSQFTGVLDDIPEYYVSTIPPKWFLHDRDNIVFWKGIRTINEKVKIKRKWRGAIFREGIIEYCQYDVWGFVSDVIRRVVYETK